MVSQKDLDEYNKHFWEQGILQGDSSAAALYFAQAQARIEFISKILGSLENCSILDIGAGQGPIFDVLRKAKLTSFDYVAVEPDVGCQNKLRAKKVKKVVASHKGLSKNSYDLIILSHVLEHVIAPQGFLRALGPLLKNDGVIFVEVPNKDYIYKDAYDPHLLFFDSHTLKLLFEQAGFEVVCMQSSGRPLQEVILQTKTRSLRRRISLKIFSILAGILRKEYLKHFCTRQFQLRCYGQERQWLRALIRRKITF